MCLLWQIKHTVNDEIYTTSANKIIGMQSVCYNYLPFCLYKIAEKMLKIRKKHNKTNQQINIHVSRHGAK